MVHRKSTYKLNYKNFSNAQRKNIWIENSHIRESRRNNEMSHHTIDENESDCDCDESSDTDEVDHKEKKITFTDESTIRNPSESQKNCIKISELSSNSYDGSDSNSLKAPPLKELKGVLKYSPSGEYDLIPSVGENRPMSTSKKIGNYGRSRSMYTLNEKGVINVTSTKQEEDRNECKPTSVPLTLRSRSSEAVFSTGHRNVFRETPFVISRRTTPRMGGKELHFTSKCYHCGKSTHQRGIFS